MPRGHPDWGATQPTATIATVLDLGEAAVRLGSSDRFDRRGHVVFIESFGHGRLRWPDFSSGAGSGSALSADRSRSTAYSLKLTAGSDGAVRGGVYHSEPYPILSRFGIETAIAFENGISRIQAQIDVYDGATAYFFRWRYDHTAGKIQYYAPGEVWTDLATGLNLFYDDYLFSIFKLVCDLSTQKYVRLLLNQRTYDMANLTPHSAASTAVARLHLFLVCYGPGATNPACYLDDVIITQNEP